jgi:hypothetical protein
LYIILYILFFDLVNSLYFKIKTVSLCSAKADDVKLYENRK